MRTVGTAVVFGPVQGSAKEVSCWFATGAVNVEVFEIIAHLDGVIPP